MSSSMPGKVARGSKKSRERSTRLLRDFYETRGEAKVQLAQGLTFDHYEVELHNEEVWRGNRVLPLTSKAFAVLRYLVEYAGQLVSKAELFYRPMAAMSACASEGMIEPLTAIAATNSAKAKPCRRSNEQEITFA